jgi:cobalt-zinc-cadmium efflux system protein
MGHNHHGHHHHHAPQRINTVFATAVICNLVYTILQAGFAVHAHSMSLLADAGHNFGDVLGLCFAWLASWLTTRPSTHSHSYGYKRTTILAALINAMILILACLIISYESILRLIHTTTIHAPIVIIVAAIGIIINGGTSLLFIKGSHNDLNLKGAFLHLATDALVSLGVVIAAIIIYYTHWTLIDPIVGLLIVVAILYGTWGLLRDSINLILDGVPRNINQTDVRDYLSTVRGVKGIHDLHIWALSTNETALTAHLIVPDAQLSDDDYTAITHHLKSHFNISHVTIQTERGENPDCCTASDC